ncbi:zinc-binding alcohol dehydrogenase [Acuticoccus sp. I52.16.1]|uniref:zinc-dependent alcohol dehydrogenase n=1 Tax=Acuticoccus sp. I52.16.1 TaxID=2928472 RepID=UPI001FD292D7|nr:zinc-binding alcohol dehydrogenase [Acuticoccus sp. I52.16.1]UOM35809.1 zinc-binding alcohol dehydrogenase [Acuticoccus sp. I52.16.1]
MEERPVTTTGVRQATALWCVAAGRYALRPAPQPLAGADTVRIAARYSAVSRGTERLVLEGRVPDSEADRMRCPNQEGEFPFPVKYGYAMVGEIVDGPAERRGERVFLLHPHQTLVTVPAAAAVAVPPAVPSRRATLAANMETALNVVWDSRAAPGDHILVIGAGVVGLLVARILARIPGTTVTVMDRDEAKRGVVSAMGAAFGAGALPGAPVDVAINASGSGAALTDAIAGAGLEARIVEASWVGDGTVAVPLGGAFHSQRLTLVSSQVGRVPAERAARWTTTRRLQTALALLDDPALDVLLTHNIAFGDAPDCLPRLLTDDGPLAITLEYVPE